MTGFLEGGKTTVIRGILQKGLGDYSGTTVLIDTEEDGIETYPEELLRERKVVFFDLDGAFGLTDESLRQIEESCRPSQVFIEWGSLFEVRYLDELKLPEGWEIVRQMAVFDASVFRKYLDHQKRMIEDMTRSADVILMNRCTERSGKGDEEDRKYFRDFFARIAPKAQVVFESCI